MAKKGMGELPTADDPDDNSDVSAEDLALLDMPGDGDDDETETSPGGLEYRENDDGTVSVIRPETDTRQSEAFDENLAESLDQLAVKRLGIDYSELIEQDIEAREKRDKQYAEGIKRTGMGNEAPGGADFEGATRVVHPMLTKGCVDFASRAIKELFPSNGPCKTQIIGEQTEDKLDKAERKKQYMNWQCTTQIQENRSELEKLLSQVPLGGAQYKRWWYDPELKRNRTEAVFIDNVFTPYGHSDFYTSPRVTYRQRILASEYERRIRTGLYRKLDLPESALGVGADESESQTSTDKVEGVDPDVSVLNRDGLRIIYEVQIQTTLEGLDPMTDEGVSAPYIFHIDKESKEVLGIYRNWAEDDERYRKKHWMTEWPFIPWRDGPAVGLSHIIGTLSGAATGALRAILDAAQIQNFPGGLMLEGGKTPGQSIKVNATELARISPPAGMTDPDIRKLVMGFPFNGPSAVLFSTLEWLTQQAEAVVATASEKIADAKGDMPVGTALALIEHGSANFSAIHARLHAAMKKDLEILHRLNAENMDDEETVEDLGELVVRRADFVGPMDIIPVSDPNIFSETQRYAQLQAVMQLKADPGFAGYFKQDQLLARALKLLQVPDVEGIANLPKDAKRLGAIDENYVASSADNARPLKAYDNQDHFAHLKMHIQFGTSPMMGANPLIAGGVMPKLLQHCKEHLLMLYKQHTDAAIEAMTTISKMQGMQMKPEELELNGAAFADQIMAQILGPMVMPGLQQMQKIVDEIGKASAPKADPNTSLQEETKLKIETARAQAKAQDSELKKQLETMSSQLELQMANESIASTERLAQLATSVDLIKQQQKEANDLMLQQLAGEQAERLAVLTAALADMSAKVTAQGDAMKADAEARATTAQSQNGVINDEMKTGIRAILEDVLQNTASNPANQIASTQQNIMAILEQEHQNNQAAFQQLAAGLVQLSQERHSEVFVGPDGKKRARSYYPGQQQPQPQGQPQPGVPPQ